MDADAIDASADVAQEHRRLHLLSFSCLLPLTFNPRIFVAPNLRMAHSGVVFST